MTSYAYLSDSHPSAGGLSPTSTAHETLSTGEHHLTESPDLILLKNLYGGILISAGGTLSLLLATGFPALGDANPALPRLLQGLTFPLGLVVVYLVGAELFTGYPMWLSMTALTRQGRVSHYARAILGSLVGNFLGALFWAGVQSYLTETLTEEPWRSRIVQQVDEEITDVPWHVIFLRAVGCGLLVTVAMLLGSQNKDGISKALGLHVPFFISTAAKFPHTVEYMYLGCTGLLLGGTRMTGWMFVWKGLLPIVLGNTVGGALTGVYHWWVYIVRSDDQEQSSGQERNWLPVDRE